jgi:uncharacterized protein YciI
MPVVLLSYEYVYDILERRKPHREAHLAHIERAAAGGSLVVAGAVGDPPHGAAFVFEDESDAAAAAEEFAAGDPYVAAGLVSDRRIEPWTVVSNAWGSRPDGR